MLELLAEGGQAFFGWGPIGVAGVAVEHHSTGLQCVLEFVLREAYCLVVAIGADDLEVHAVGMSTLCANRFRILQHFHLNENLKRVAK